MLMVYNPISARERAGQRSQQGWSRRTPIRRG